MQEIMQCSEVKMFSQRIRTGGQTVLIPGGSDDGGVRPVPHLQEFFQ